MPDTLAELVARLKAQTPGLADVPDAVLAQSLLADAQAGAGPSVADALGTPTFRTSNERTPAGDAVVRAPVSPWTKAATIGAPGIGEHYSFPSVGEVLASDQPLKLLAQFVTGHGRPRAVANADPLGLQAFTEGKGPMPLFMGSTEEVGAAGRGLYSRVDDAVQALPKKGAHPNAIAGFLKSNASAEELAYRQVPEFLAAKGNATVTPGELQAHLAAHPAPMPVVKTLGGPASARPMPEGYHIEPLAAGNRPGAQYNYTLVGPEGSGRAFYATDAADAQMMANDMLGLNTKAPTKYAQYQLPGGEQYQETLLTLPTPKASHDQYLYDETVRELTARHGPNYRDHLTNSEINQLDVLALNQYQDKGTFRSSHFEEPNILVHTRSNTRTLPTGERGRFVEEVQSDWHQAGKTKGYQRDTSAELAKLASEWETARRTMMATDDAASVAAQTRMGEITDRMNALHDLAGGVPDAPFKETWPDLGLKQQLLEAAKDPEAQWLGFTSGQTQAARYDLSKQISRVEFDAGDRQLRAFDHGGREVIRQTTGPEDLSDYIGKEAAQKLLASTPSLHPADQTPLYSLSGVNLQVGGEGMRHFYDELLPKRLQKIVKPFGGTVERTTISGDPSAPADVVARYANQPDHPFTQKQHTPAWIVRLTPAMKARIVKEGLPLGLLLGAAAGPSVAEALGDRPVPTQPHE